MTLAAAAKVLGVHVATLRKWIRQGAPTLALGEIGRGHSSEVDLEAIRTWRAQRVVPSLTATKQEDILKVIVTVLVDCIKRDVPSYHSYLSQEQMMVAALTLFQRAYLNVTRDPLTADQLPPELKPFHAIVLESMERGTFYQRR